MTKRKDAAASVPSHAIGMSDRSGGFEWLLRLRNPFMLVHVERLSKWGANLDLWPADLSKCLRQVELRDRLEKMLSLFREFRKSEWPVSWDFEFKNEMNLPKCILLANPIRKWIGVLYSGDGSLWVPQDRVELIEVRGHFMPGALERCANFSSRVEEVHEWYAEIVRA